MPFSKLLLHTGCAFFPFFSSHLNRKQDAYNHFTGLVQICTLAWIKLERTLSKIADTDNLRHPQPWSRLLIPHVHTSLNFFGYSATCFSATLGETCELQTQINKTLFLLPSTSENSQTTRWEAITWFKFRGTKAGPAGKKRATCSL